MDPSSQKEVKLSYDSFIENRDVLSWNILISSKISKTEENLIQCKECKFSGDSQPVLVSHVEMRHLENFPGYTCILCRVVLQTWIIFKRHVNSVHCSTPELMKSSLQNLPSRASLRNGINGFSYDKTPKISFAALQSESSLKCSLCDFQTSEVNTLNIHNQYIHGPIKSLNSEVFQPKVKESEEYKNGRRVMRVPGPMPGAGTTRRHAMGLGFKCLKCDKHFTYREELYNHSVQDHMYNPPGQISYELPLDNNKTEFSISEVSFEIPVYQKITVGKIHHLSHFPNHLLSLCNV